MFWGLIILIGMPEKKGEEIEWAGKCLRQSSDKLLVSSEEEVNNYRDYQPQGANAEKGPPHLWDELYLFLETQTLFLTIS